MNAYFAKLGRDVAALWKAENFSPTAFPRIATRALEKNLPAKHVDLAELVRDFLRDDEQPFQTASGFGQPELIVYDDPRFYIQVLFWLDGTTDIHQHEFSGAFHVLAGSSIHSHFEFRNVRPISAHLRMGDLHMKDIRLLETGATVPIIAGSSCIHSLFHLDTPSVSVVVRTHHDPGTGPQFTYLPPHVAVDPNHHDALTLRRKQLLDLLERTDDPDYVTLVQEMINGLDFERGFFVLQNGAAALKAAGAWEKTLRLFVKKHGPLARGVAPTLEEIIRRDALAAYRASVMEPEHRFFLALLLNVSTRAPLLRFVSQRYPGQAVRTVMRWAEELLEVSELGVSLLDASFPEDLEVPIEAQMTVFLAALKHFVSGGKSRSLSAVDLSVFRDAFARSSLRVFLT